MAGPARQRAETFARRYGLSAPVLLAPMAGVSPVALSAALAGAGGMAALGALLLQPAEILAWTAELRVRVAGPVQINLWVPEPAPVRDEAGEAAMRDFLAAWGPPVPAPAGDARPVDFEAQFAALLQARPTAASTIMGLLSPLQVQRLREAGIAWLACATTLAEALAAQAAGADAVVAQGFEAGGHRGAFDAAAAERQAIGLFSLLPRLAAHLEVPIIAAGGIADGQGIAAALTLGASAVQIGSGFLRSPEAGLPTAWAEALARAEPEDSWPTRAFSGRLGRALATDYVRAAASDAAPRPQPYPVQRGLTAPMRQAAQHANALAGLQAWGGQSAWMAPARPAADSLRQWWQQAQALLP